MPVASCLCVHGRLLGTSHFLDIFQAFANTDGNKSYLRP